MKQKFIIFIWAILLTCFCCGANAVMHQKTGKTSALIPINRIVAIVNDDVITQAQLDHQVAIIKVQMKSKSAQLPSDKVLRSQMLQRMIDRKLQLQMAARTGISISKAELNAALKRIAKQNGTSLSALYKKVGTQGWTVKEFRQEIQDEITIQKLQGQKVASRISISQQEVQGSLQEAISNKAQVMEEYHVGDILIPLFATPTPKQVAAAQKKAKSIIKQLQKGADFKKLAAAESQLNTGSDLGWRKLAELPQAFVTKISKMKTGGIDGPIQTPNGFHIIKLLGKRGATTSGTYEQSQIQIIMLKRKTKAEDKILLNKLMQIRTRIGKGADFNTLAKKYSQDSKSAKTGGYIGWVSQGQFGPLFDSVLKHLKTGEISQPISTNKGVYLIKVIAKRRASKTTQAEKSQIEQWIFHRKLIENLQIFINQLRSNAYIKIFSH